MKQFLILEIIPDKYGVSTNYQTRGIPLIVQIGLIEAHKQKLVEEYNKKTKQISEVKDYGQD